MIDHTSSRRPAGEKVIVIGGGVAGLAAAVALAEDGFRVTLLEKRATLGGRASSFTDQTTGEMVDNCQHITMRCCTNLEFFYRRIGVWDKIRFYSKLTFLDQQGKPAVIQNGSPFPAPFHTLFSFARFHPLSLSEKSSVAKALIAILRAGTSPNRDSESIGNWLRKQKQPERAMAHFWRPILVSACNEEPDRISCEIGFKLFRDGFLSNAEAYQMGVPSVRLSDLYTQPSIETLSALGADIQLKIHVDALSVADRKVESVTLSDGTTLSADFYLSAVPFDIMLKMLHSDIREAPFFKDISLLEYSPITGVHLWFDKPFEVREPIALLDRETQWIFPKENTQPDGAELSKGGAYLALVVSSSKSLLSLSADEIIDICLKEVQEALPQSRSARLLHGRVIKEKKATFAPIPGVESLRPKQTTPIENLFLAGDWTRTGWPATMESAARSGYLAAERIMERAGRPKSLLQPDMPPSRLAKWFLGK